jgi:hypothetical protein
VRITDLTIVLALAIGQIADMQEGRR